MSVFDGFISGIDSSEHRERMKEVLSWVHDENPDMERVVKWNQPKKPDMPIRVKYSVYIGTGKWTMDS